MPNIGPNKENKEKRQIAWSMNRVLTKPSQVVIAGIRGAEDTEALLRIVDENFDKYRLVLLVDEAENQIYLSKRLPFLETVTRLEDKTTAYVQAYFLRTLLLYHKTLKRCSSTLI